MKAEIQRKVGFYEVDAAFSLRFKSLLQYFQDLTGVHSDLGGCGIRWLMGQGRAWVLHRTCVRVHRTPCLGDDLRILTWSRGAKGFRAYRDFEIFCRGEKIVSATSLWIFIDTEKKKILKVPEEAAQWYTVETDRAMDMDIDGFHPNLKFEPEWSQTIEIRPSDFDPLDHVNNALYLDFLENLICRTYPDQKRIREVVIQFHNEIPKQVERVEIGIQKKDGLNEFKIFSLECVHAVGTFQLFDPPESDPKAG
jgi:acyl-ACP thioesterase